MTKATGDGCYKLLATEGRTGEPIGRAVELGSYTYIPAPKHSATTVSGTPSNPFGNELVLHASVDLSIGQPGTISAA
jgi:hypothetical protein